MSIFLTRRRLRGSSGFMGNFDLKPDGIYLSLNYVTIYPRFLQSEVKEFILKNFKCAFCGLLINPEFRSCTCGQKQNFKVGIYKAPEKLWETVKKICLKYNPQTEAQKRRSLMRSVREKASKGSYSKKDLALLWKKQSGKCFYCLKSFGEKYDRSLFEVDHIKRISSGGSNWPKNLRLACRSCNASRK